MIEVSQVMKYSACFPPVSSRISENGPERISFRKPRNDPHPATKNLAKGPSSLALLIDPLLHIVFGLERHPSPAWMTRAAAELGGRRSERKLLEIPKLPHPIHPTRTNPYDLACVHRYVVHEAGEKCS